MSTRSVEQEQTAWPARVLRWRVIAGISAPLALLGGVGLTTFFILREDWNSVLASSLFFFSVFQLLYWYLRAKTLCSNRRQVEATYLFIQLCKLTCFNIFLQTGGEGQGMMSQSGTEGCGSGTASPSAAQRRWSRYTSCRDGRTS